MNKITQKDIQTEYGDVAAGDINKPSTTYVFNNNNDLKSTIDELNKLLDEERKNERTIEITEDLKDYQTKIAGENVIGLENKLTLGGREYSIEYALRVKEKFAKKLTRLQYYESAQKIYVLFLSIIECRFHSLIYPKIIKNDPEDEINLLIESQIINPILNSLGKNTINLNAADIQGMIYYLTGNCHLNWN